MKIFKTKQFQKFAEKENIPDNSLLQAIERANNGLIDAELIRGLLIKQRVARKNSGKSGGYRTIIAFKKGDKAFFVYGFPKNKRDNIDDEELSDLKEFGKILFCASDNEIQNWVNHGKLMEIKYEKI
jgi:hypothetical protein